ncbi:MAG: type ISP restriction/modification enzyme [Coriobacteriia bacterium]|nr:type ISP restriction/modification enzyme [Coriobacteriia bacterium]
MSALNSRWFPQVKGDTECIRFENPCAITECTERPIRFSGANDVAYWRCVPANVWRYTIGGYQVIKKWLSYRERALLGRDLKPEEARYVTEMVRRIAALVFMQPELDANYERVKADVWEWGG